MKPGLLFIMLLVLCSCSTPSKDPGQLREQEPFSVGSGVLYYPNKHFTVGVVMDVKTVFTPERVIVRSGSEGSSSYSVNNQGNDAEFRRVISKKASVDFLMGYFPWNKSDFFVGVLSRSSHSRRAYNERTELFSLDQSQTNIEWEDEDVIVGPFIGFDYRKESTFAITSGTSFGKVVHRKRNFIDDGESDRVDIQHRKNTLRSFDEAVLNNWMVFVAFTFPIKSN